MLRIQDYPTNLSNSNQSSNRREIPPFFNPKVPSVYVHIPAFQANLRISRIQHQQKSLISNDFYENPERKIPNHKWRFIAGKIIYFYGPSIPWLYPNPKKTIFVASHCVPTLARILCRAAPVRTVHNLASSSTKAPSPQSHWAREGNFSAVEL